MIVIKPTFSNEVLSEVLKYPIFHSPNLGLFQ